MPKTDSIRSAVSVQYRFVTDEHTDADTRQAQRRAGKVTLCEMPTFSI